MYQTHIYEIDDKLMQNAPETKQKEKHNKFIGNMNIYTEYVFLRKDLLKI